MSRVTPSQSRWFLVLVPLLVSQGCFLDVLDGLSDEDDDGYQPAVNVFGTLVDPPPSSQLVVERARQLETQAAAAAGLDDGEIEQLARLVEDSLVPGPVEHGRHVFVPRTKADAYRYLGFAFYAEGAASAALWAWARAVLEAPEDVRPLTLVGFILDEMDRPDEALPFLLLAVNRNPEDQASWAELGHAYHVLGRPVSSLACLLRATAVGVWSASLELALAAAYERVGLRATASQVVEIATFRLPENELIHDRLQEFDDSPTNEWNLPETNRSPRPSQYVAGRKSGDNPLYETYEALKAQAEAQFDETWDDITRIKAEIQGDRSSEHGLAVIGSLNCQSNCGSSADCKARCLAAACSLETASVAHATARLKPLAPRFEAAANAYSADLLFAAASAMEQWEGQTDRREVEWVLEDLQEELQRNVLNIKGEYESSRAYVALISSERDGVCEAAAHAAAYAEWVNRLSVGVSTEVCMDGFLCIEFGINTIGFSIGIGVAQVGVSQDLRTGAATMSLGIGVTDATGTIHATLNLKYNTVKGVGIGADVAMGLLAHAKGSVDFYLWHDDP